MELSNCTIAELLKRSEQIKDVRWMVMKEYYAHELELQEEPTNQRVRDAWTNAWKTQEYLFWMIVQIMNEVNKRKDNEKE